MADPSVERNVACANCGYNLHSLPTTGRCPECGENVGESLRIPDLASQGSHWLTRVQAGLRIQIGVLLFGIVNGSLGFVAYFRLQHFMFLYRLLSQGRTHVLFVIAWLILDFAAVWLITKPALIELAPTEPATEEFESGGELTRRQFLRFFAFFSFLGGFVSFGAPAVVAGVPGLFAWVRGGIDFATVYLFFDLIEKDLARRARLSGVIRQSNLLKKIKPMVSVLLLLLIRYAYGSNWIDRATEIHLRLMRELLYIAMNFWAIAVLWALLQAFHRSMQVSGE